MRRMTGHTTSNGLTMDWNISLNHKGIPILRGYVNGEQRLSCQLLNAPEAFKRKNADKIAADRLFCIAHEAMPEGQQ
jgi:hypothetical protein